PRLPLTAGQLGGVTNLESQCINFARGGNRTHLLPVCCPVPVLSESSVTKLARPAHSLGATLRDLSATVRFIGAQIPLQPDFVSSLTIRKGRARPPVCRFITSLTIRKESRCGVSGGRVGSRRSPQQRHSARA